MSNNVKLLNNDSFDAFINQDKVSLVDFWATWCGPCKMLLPTIDAVADEMAEKANICKLDVDEAMDIAERFAIQSVPTMIIFKGGEVKEKVIGVRSKQQIIAIIEKYI